MMGRELLCFWCLSNSNNGGVLCRRSSRSLPKTPQLPGRGRAEQWHSWHGSKAGKSVDSSMQAKHEAIIQPGPASRRVTIDVVVSDGISIVAYP